MIENSWKQVKFIASNSLSENLLSAPTAYAQIHYTVRDGVEYPAKFMGINLLSQKHVSSKNKHLRNDSEESLISCREKRHRARLYRNRDCAERSVLEWVNRNWRQIKRKPISISELWPRHTTGNVIAATVRNDSISSTHALKVADNVHVTTWSSVRM